MNREGIAARLAGCCQSVGNPQGHYLVHRQRSSVLALGAGECEHERLVSCQTDPFGRYAAGELRSSGLVSTGADQALDPERLRCCHLFALDVHVLISSGCLSLATHPSARVGD